MNTYNKNLSWYELLDSGHGKRWERFGDVVLARPSRLAVWKPRKKINKVDAEFVHEKGWKLNSRDLNEWNVEDDQLSLKLRLQDNGQIGLFPEHAQYLGEISSVVAKKESPKVLNLFAYTGLATCVCTKNGAHVTHVDVSKKVLDWATENLNLNKIDKNSYRYIKEDALAFLKKESTRNNSYDVVICDPPSFSRLSQKESWDLEDVLEELVSLCVSIVAPKNGALFFTNHHYESGAHVLANLVRDRVKSDVVVKELLLPESSSTRVLPAGFLVHSQGVC